MSNDTYDVIIVGGGHNGLTAAAYLGQAGKRALLLEAQDHLGGASVSQRPFEGLDARLSRYSYLVSLLPQQIIDDLGLRITLRRRRFSSYTPLPGTDRGLLIDHGDAEATAASFAAIGAEDDIDGWRTFYDRVGVLGRALWPTVTGPLPTRSDVRRLVADDSIVTDFVKRPRGEVIERSVQNDLVRGVILTDGLIGTFASAYEPDLRQNICFLYHVMGGGTGDWDVPVGGMGTVSGELERAAREAGADLRTGVRVDSISDGTVTWDGGQAHAPTILWAAAPAVLDQVMGAEPPTVEGAQVKVNLLLERLPRLKDGVDPKAAFGGTFHINESFEQLESAYAAASSGRSPSPIPAEIYCHSLTDPSILSTQLQEAGAQTLTIFAMHTPHRLLADRNPDVVRAEFERRVLDSLSSVLAEPIEEVLMREPDGRLCVEAKTTGDLESTLGMPGGNIFHSPLTWPFAEDDEDLSTPAARWGVTSPYDGVLIAGAGSRRGGGVSGLGGYHAAMAALGR